MNFSTIHAKYVAITSVAQLIQNHYEKNNGDRITDYMELNSYKNNVEIQILEHSDLEQLKSISIQDILALLPMIELTEGKSVMKLTNQKIYEYYTNICSAFDTTEQMLPVKLNYKIQKNKVILENIVESIDRRRLEIAKKYGTLNENGDGYIVSEENNNFAVSELNDLFNELQSVELYVISYNELDDSLLLTSAQMSAILPMVSDTDLEKN